MQHSYLEKIWLTQMIFDYFYYTAIQIVTEKLFHYTILYFLMLSSDISTIPPWRCSDKSLPTSIKYTVPYTTLNSLYTIAYSTSTVMEWLTTCISSAHQLTTIYYSALGTLMITCLKKVIVCSVYWTQSLNTNHYCGLTSEINR